MSVNINPEKLVLLDRDGVINEDSDAYIKNPEEWLAIPGSLEAIANLNAQGVQVIVVTNQSGVGRGMFTEDTLLKIHQKMFDELSAKGGEILDVVYCPHLPDAACSCRKPATGMLDFIEHKYQISLKGVPFVGDTGKDLELAFKKSCLPVLVKTGKGNEYFSTSYKNDPWFSSSLAFSNLEEACNYLLKNKLVG